MKTTDISNRDAEARSLKKQRFNFPTHGVTVEAESLEEAQKLLEKELKQS